MKADLTLLITGGAGFIGTNLVREAIAQGFRVINLDALTYAGNRGSLADLEGRPEYVFVHGSIGDEKLVSSLLGEYQPAGILNLAAESHVDRSIDSPWAFIDTNIVGTFQLLEASRKHFAKLESSAKERFRFVHVSTDEVYGSTDTDAFTEDSVYRPNSPYAASKASADHLVRAYWKTYRLPAMITNCSNNYGPYQFPEKLIPLMILNAIDFKPLPIYGDGGQVRDWLHVLDHCKAILHVFQKGRLGEKYNISAENRVTNVEVVKEICRILSDLRPPSNGRTYESLMTPVQDRPGHDRRYALDAAKLRKELGWKPTVGFSEGLRKTVQWYLDQSGWWTEIRKNRYDGRRLGQTRA